MRDMFGSKINELSVLRLETTKQWYIPLLIAALLKHEDMNVIFCDWSRGAFFPYHQAVGNVRLVGTCI